MPPGWPATRARILARDGGRCRYPGCTAPATEVHHTQPGVEDDATLVSLCAPHHKAISSAQALAARGLAPLAADPVAGLAGITAPERRSDARGQGGAQAGPRAPTRRSDASPPADPAAGWGATPRGCAAPEQFLPGRIAPRVSAFLGGRAGTALPEAAQRRNGGADQPGQGRPGGPAPDQRPGEPPSAGTVPRPRLRPVRVIRAESARNE
jgi:hypothetical protein